jgi:peroxiredoxin
MKKLLLIAMVIPAAIFAQTGYTIKGNIKGLKDSTLVFLTNGSGATVAQDYANKGAFTLKGMVNDADLFQVGFIGYKDVLDVYLGNDNVSLTGDALKLKSVLVTGAKYNEDYKLYQQQFNPLKEKLGVLAGKINGEPAGAKRDSLIRQFVSVKSSVEKQVNVFIKEKPASPVSSFVLFVVNPLFDGVNVLENKYNALQPAAKKGNYAKMIEQMIVASKVGSIGSVAADFTQNDTANNPVKLSSFKGKYVLVDFWASWCRPCRMENPNVVAAYNTFKGKNFTVLSVSLDKEKENWVKAITDDKLTWTHVSDLQYWNNAAARLYNIESIPQNMLLDPEGKIIAKDLRGDDLQNTLKQLLH